MNSAICRSPPQKLSVGVPDAATRWAPQMNYSLREL